jgi:hypothetical protein
MAAFSSSLEDIERIRRYLWRTDPSRQISDERGALRLIRELGFVLLMPITGAELPNVHRATAREWSWWDWKQTLPGRKACYYSHLLRNRGTFVSWEWFPHFRAVYGQRKPYQQIYREGLLDRDEKRILDLIEANGPMMTGEIRVAFAPRSKQNTRRAKAMLVDLQRRFLITAAGGDTEGWSHHRWELVERWVRPDLRAEANQLSRAAAQESLIARFVSNVVATTEADIAWVFGWERREIRPIIARLLSAQKLQVALVPELEGEVIAPRPWPRIPGRRGDRAAPR